MLTESDLQELLHFQAKHPVLSVYINTDPSQGSADAYELQLRNMLKELNLPADAAAVERYFKREFDWSGRSVAVFSCAPQKFFRAFPLAIPVRSRLRVSDHPHVKPLADLLDSYGGYGVALVDKQGARLFYFHLGELREQEGVMGESVRHTKRGGASSFPGRRGGVAGQTKYAEEVADRNMKETVEFAAHFFGEKDVRRVLIGGTDENIALFRSFLPKSWQSLIIGTFPMSMTASKNEVLARTMQIGQEVEARRDAQLVKTIITNAAKGRGGVIGLDDTLEAVHAGRVQTLVVKEGFIAPGFRCLTCDNLTTHILEACPFCGGKLDNIQDAVELAVRKVMQDDGEVNFLHISPKDFDDIGAILRY